jgi:hypothetical protein
MDALVEALRNIVGVIEAHELTSLSCDNDGEKFCDCLDNAVKQAKTALAENAPMSFSEWAKSMPDSES